MQETTSFNACTEMKLHLGNERAAVMRFSESRYALSLDLILVPSGFRSSGLGTALIHRLFAIADSLGKPVHTMARPIGQSNPEALARLVRYYERLGFMAIEGGFGSVHMKRAANSGSPSDGVRAQDGE